MQNFQGATFTCLRLQHSSAVGHAVLLVAAETIPEPELISILESNCELLLVFTKSGSCYRYVRRYGIKLFDVELSFQRSVQTANKTVKPAASELARRGRGVMFE